MNTKASKNAVIVLANKLGYKLDIINRNIYLIKDNIKLYRKSYQQAYQYLYMKKYRMKEVL